MSAVPEFDYRLANPLVCHPEDGPGRFASDTLHRAASTLQLFSSLIGGSQDGINEVFAEEDRTFALCLQLDGIALALRAVAEALHERKAALGPDEIPIRLSVEEQAKLEKIACRRGCSVTEAARTILADSLSDFKSDHPRAKN